jgi:hypothetical protein
MSSVGLTPQSKDHELEKMREAWRSLNDLLNNLSNAEACLKNLDLKLTSDHIKTICRCVVPIEEISKQKDKC